MRAASPRAQGFQATVEPGRSSVLGATWCCWGLVKRKGGRRVEQKTAPFAPREQRCVGLGRQEKAAGVTQVRSSRLPRKTEVDGQGVWGGRSVAGECTVRNRTIQVSWRGHLPGGAWYPLMLFKCPSFMLSQDTLAVSCFHKDHIGHPGKGFMSHFAYI